jgi:hypothetical protein
MGWEASRRHGKAPDKPVLIIETFQDIFKNA